MTVDTPPRPPIARRPDGEPANGCIDALAALREGADDEAFGSELTDVRRRESPSGVGRDTAATGDAPNEVSDPAEPNRDTPDLRLATGSAAVTPPPGDVVRNAASLGGVRRDDVRAVGRPRTDVSSWAAPPERTGPLTVNTPPRPPIARRPDSDLTGGPADAPAARPEVPDDEAFGSELIDVRRRDRTGAVERDVAATGGASNAANDSAEPNRATPDLRLATGFAAVTPLFSDALPNAASLGGVRLEDL